MELSTSLDRLDLVSHRDPVLREKIPEFDPRDPGFFPEDIAKRMEEALVRYGGIGLAANQVGLRVRCFSLKMDPTITLFNPKIIDISEEKVLMDEGCLTYPGIILKISRPRLIKVRYMVHTGEFLTSKFDGVTARAIQHEIDHLDGILFTDYAGKVKMKMALDKARKNGHNNYVMKDFD